MVEVQGAGGLKGDGHGLGQSPGGVTLGNTNLTDDINARIQLLNGGNTGFVCGNSTNQLAILLPNLEGADQTSVGLLGQSLNGQGGNAAVGEVKNRVLGCSHGSPLIGLVENVTIGSGNLMHHVATVLQSGRLGMSSLVSTDVNSELAVNSLNPEG